MAAGTLAVFALARNDDLDPDVAGTMAFTTFVMFQLFNALNVRSERSTVFRRHTFTNWRLWIALSAVALLQILVVQTPAFGRIFDTEPLDAGQWAACAAVAVAILVVEEVRKVATRLHEGRKS
jgi:Ca2+-transporting ATPase